MKALYLALVEQLKNKVSELAHITLFGNQLQSLSKQIMFFPCVMIEFANLNYTDLGASVQEADTMLNFYLAIDFTGLDAYDGAANQVKALEIFDLKDKLHACLQGFSGAFFTPLVRLSERQDANYDSLFVFQLTYQTKLTDTVAWTGWEQDEVIDVNIEIEKDLDIQNTKIRT